MKFFFVLFLGFTLTFGASQQKSKTFHDAGIYSTIQWSAEESMSIIPQAWLYINNFYLEGRYNYEDENTVSLYFGREFSISEKIEMEIIPMIGVVYGNLLGISPGINFQLETDRYSVFAQCQYTFDLEDISNSFFWDWSSFSIDIWKGIALGGSIQIFHNGSGESFNRVGPLIGYQHGSITIEAYGYNFWHQFPVYALGIEFRFD